MLSFAFNRAAQAGLVWLVFWVSSFSRYFPIVRKAEEGWRAEEASARSVASPESKG